MGQMLRANGQILPAAIIWLSRAFTRVCQPGPLQRRYSTVVASRRIFTSTFGASIFGRPRRDGFIPTMNIVSKGGLSLAGSNSISIGLMYTHKAYIAYVIQASICCRSRAFRPSFCAQGKFLGKELPPAKWLWGSNEVDLGLVRPDRLFSYKAVIR